VIKQRIAWSGQGNSGGFRTLIISGRVHGPSSFTASRRTNRTASGGTTQPSSKSSHPNCWPMTIRRSAS